MTLACRLFITIAIMAFFSSATNCRASEIMDNNTENASTTAAHDTDVTMHTTAGDITLRLYADTPAHMQNFIKLAREGFYDGLLFHRVINDFMIQGGDPDSRNAPKGKMLGMGEPGYQLDAEIVYPRHFHKRGALAAAREGDATNPLKRSSGSQFYIVTGKRFTDGQLTAMEQNLRRNTMQQRLNELARENRDTIMTLRRNRDTAALMQLQNELTQQAAATVNPDMTRFTPEQRQAYTTVGGTPHLDGAYTVFGEVIDGMDVVDAIQKSETDGHDRPTDDIRIISVEVK